jgi:dimethylargininase
MSTARFTQAIVRPPGASFVNGLTTAAALGAPDLARARAQHQAYVAALRSCGLQVTELAPDEAYPDSTFVEDTAVISQRVAVATRPGAPTRAGEVTAIVAALQGLGREPVHIQAPGTVDGGDICQMDDHFLIGVSARTNENGAHQLADILRRQGYRTSLIDVRTVPGLLHLKSGLSWLGDQRMMVAPGMPRAGALAAALAGIERIEVDRRESYAANCVRVNDKVLIASGFPHMAVTLAARGIATISLEMSEFQKMDGGLSCLSLRF